ncbi:MAG: AMP-binding protein, partial [Alphaproteobacteria bacterium]|nr:AMP-binding protein [Alphaproteobacteria bacterium]
MAMESTYPAASFGSMYEVVRDWAARTPEAPAILFGAGQAYCYRDLLSRIDSIGRQLNGLGFGRGDRIAFVHPGGSEMALSILGLWSYATVIPMNPNCTIGEVALHLRDLRVKAVLMSAGMDTPARSAAGELSLPQVSLLDEGSEPVLRLTGTCRPDGAPERPGPVGADDIATVIVTSGTTGHGKIVPIRHRHLLRRNVYAAHQLALTAEDRCLNLLRLYHSGGLNQGLCLGLVAGGSVGLPSEYSVEGFFAALKDQEPTWCTGVYTFYHAIHGELAHYRAAIDRMSGRLRFMRCGNGRLPHDAEEKVEKAFGAPLLSTYGTSEGGAISSEPLPPAPRKRGSVGTAAHGNIAILDEAGRALPAGVHGEVAVSGETVFDGYENDASANAAAFVDGWFRTGDEGYFDADGYLFLTGRIKEMINRGGEKVTPSEVEAA